ncbi:MAG: RNA polymerase sigma-54 factor [Proteobacteria bacterium]|nr:RNA polymerase sigma-54 factor [Pseudomonadota bacterium]
MANSQRLEIRQGQSLVMTPQLQQSLKMLQYTSQELLAYIEEQLEKNPLLQAEDVVQELADTKEETAEADAQAEREGDSVNGETVAAVDPGLDISYDSNGDETESKDWESEPSTESSYQVYDHGRSQHSDYEGGGYNFEQSVSGQVTLRDHLLDQIDLDFHSNAEKIIAVHLVDLLDDSGYVTASLDSVAFQLGCEVQAVEEVLLKLQKCDPAGVFARNLKECLALQLKEKNRLDPAMQMLIDHLELVAKAEIAQLEKLCGVSKEDVMEMLKEIRSLNPKPGSGFDQEVSETIQHDVFVRRAKDGSGYHVELNSEVLPKLLLNKRYYAEIKQRTKNEQEKKYLSDQWGDANWLIKTLNQRAESILKVATELVIQQSEFFEKGISHLKPLTLKSIAEKVDLHESTVGRVTQGKYMATPRGVYEMKFFFSSSVQSVDGQEDVSSTSVKHVIKELIDNEASDKILSDDKIAEILTARGIEVARRTVMKYREAMHIGSSVERRRQKRMQAASKTA